MRFGIDHLFTWRGDRTQAQVIHEAVEQTVLAEELGFDQCWIAEHHFSDYGIVGGLSTMAAALAQATERIRIGLAVAVLPLAHPLRLAEDLALVDVLSNGRLDIGVGRGYQPEEFRHFNIPFDEASSRFEETLQVMKLAWTGEPFSFEGRHFSFKDVQIFPTPLQQPNPPIYQAAVSSSTFERAGRNGMQILTSPNFTPIEVVRKNFGAYRAALAGAGFSDSEFVYPMLQQVYVTEDPDEAVRFPEPYAMYFYDRLSHLLPSTESGDIPADYGEYGRMQRNVRDLQYDFLMAHGVNFGTPDQVIERIQALRDEAGVDNYIGWFNFGGMPADKVASSMRLFAKEVIPAFADAPAPQGMAARG